MLEYRPLLVWDLDGFPRLDRTQDPAVVVRFSQRRMEIQIDNVDTVVLFTCVLYT